MNNTASFSIGFMSQSRPRKGGKGREIYEVDFLEISVTATPVHPATKVLGGKSTDADCPRHLIGTAWDPAMAIGEPVEVPQKSWSAIPQRKPPIRIASFRID